MSYINVVYIATKFQEYNQRNVNTKSQYDSFYEFLIDYENEINNYLDNNIEFCVVEDDE